MSGSRRACPEPWSCLDVFHASPVDRIRMIRGGVRAQWVTAALGSFIRGCNPELSALKLTGAALGKSVAQDGRLSQIASERLLGIAGLIGQVEAMISQSGARDGFEASQWFAEWVLSPVPAFGGVRPIEYLDTWEGRTIVSNLLAQMQSAAYA